VTRTTRILDDPEEAAAVIRSGGLVAFPTETVYGLGADALNPDAIAAVFAAKGRPDDNPLIVHVAEVSGVSQVCDAIPPAASALLAAFSPGPLTLVVPRSERVPPSVSAGLGTVGVRIPGHPVAQALLRAARCPVAAPSANRSGRPSATTWEAVLADLDGRVDAVLRGSRPKVGIESTVVDCTGPVPAILRAGSVTLEQLRTVIPETIARGEREAASPGTRHLHYAPDARVRVVEAPSPRSTAAYIGWSRPGDGYMLESLVDGLDEYAHALYDFFRRCDQAGVQEIDCEWPTDVGIGRALQDRLRRAEAASAA
jgi:L-threonylcarbamoyladenylate synthase